MIDIFEELKTLTQTLESRGVEYALCGGLAMAVHGYVRATVDIDLLVLPGDLKPVFEIVQGLGYDIEAKPMRFAQGKVSIHRLSKMVSESRDILSVDLILVSEEIGPVWESREKVRLEDGVVTVVSRNGLIDLKRLRGNKQDVADIERLGGEGDDS